MNHNKSETTKKEKSKYSHTHTHTKIPDHAKRGNEKKKVENPK